MRSTASPSRIGPSAGSSLSCHLATCWVTIIVRDAGLAAGCGGPMTTDAGPQPK